MDIRKAVISDITKIKEGLIDSWVEHSKNEPQLLDEERMRQSNVEKYYGEALADTEKSIVLVAVEGRDILGFIRADIQSLPPFFKDYDKTLMLDDVYVFPSYRRRGIANKLIDEIENIAKENGLKRIQARIYSYNKPMQELMKKKGFGLPYSTWNKELDK